MKWNPQILQASFEECSGEPQVGRRVSAEEDALDVVVISLSQKKQEPGDPRRAHDE